MFSFFGGGKKPEPKQPAPEARKNTLRKGAGGARAGAGEDEYAKGEVIDAQEAHQHAEEVFSPEKLRILNAERLVNVFMLKIQGPVQVANTITNHTTIGPESPAVTAAVARVRNAKSSLMSKLFLAAALTFGVHEVMHQTMDGNTEELATQLNDGPLVGKAHIPLEALTKASVEYQRLEGQIQDGLRTIMQHAKRDIDAVRREEMAQAAEAQQNQQNVAYEPQVVNSTRATTEAVPTTTPRRGTTRHHSSHHGRRTADR